jgi:UDP-glucose 4-epimerase
MRILVTGGAGFIGSNLVDKLLALGHQVVVVDNLTTGKEENLEWARKQENSFSFYKMDIREQSLGDLMVERLPEAVMHLAAQVSVRESVSDPTYDADVNIVGTLNLLQGSVACGAKRFVFASSGGAIYAEPQYFPVDEEHPKQPLSPYGISKKVVDDYLVFFQAGQGLSYTSLALANIYGPRQDPYGEAGVVAIFIGQMLGGSIPTINGDGEQVRDFVYVGDAVDAFILALEKPCQGLYNIGTGIGTSVNQLYEKLSTLLAFDNEPTYGAPMAGEMRAIYLNSGRAQRELGWQAKTSLDEGLMRTIAFFREKTG